MFGIEIIDASLLPAMLVAAVAGVLSFLSPCVLPIVPPYLAYMGGISMGEMRAGTGRRRIVLPALFFVLGLSTVFLFLGFTASIFGRFFLENQEVLAKVSGAVVIARLFLVGEKCHGAPAVWLDTDGMCPFAL